MIHGNKKAAKRFLKKALGSNHNWIPRVITVDKNPAYPVATQELKNYRTLPQNVRIRQIKYLDNIIEQNHRSIKLIVNSMLGFQSFHTAIKTLKGIEIMNMIKRTSLYFKSMCSCWSQLYKTNYLEYRSKSGCYLRNILLFYILCCKN